MEYRQLPHGSPNERFGVLGLGMGGIQHTPAAEIKAIIRKAIDHGINFFDLCAGGAVYAPFGRAIAANHYTKLSVKADACLQCGNCSSRCPFGVAQQERMAAIADYFG